MCLTRLQAAIKETINSLERDVLGLGDEEPDEDGGEDHKCREEEIHAVAHSGEHLRSEARDEEIPEPVVGGCEGLGEGSHVLVEHFGVEDPGSGVPGWGVEGLWGLFVSLSLVGQKKEELTVQR